MVDKLSQFVRFEDLQISSAELSATLSMPAEWPEFSGHFPGNPVLPAVSVIDISIFLIQSGGYPVSYQKFAVEKTRFTGRVVPGLPVKILATSSSAKAWKIEWTSADDGTALAQVQISFS